MNLGGSEEGGLLHDAEELLLVHLAISIPIGLVNHLLQLLICAERGPKGLAWDWCMPLVEPHACLPGAGAIQQGLTSCSMPLIRYPLHPDDPHPHR